MSETGYRTVPTTAEVNGDSSSGGLWPSPDYARQVEQLRAAVGATIFIAELTDTEVQLGVRLTDRPYVLLGVLDFPRPDPTKGLAPHLVLLDDGRGVNLGRIARISTGRAFGPAPAEILFQDRTASQTLLFRERQLSKAFIAARSKQVLGQLLGGPAPSAGPLLPGPGATEPPPNAV
jgi:hypothetical protein